MHVVRLGRVYTALRSSVMTISTFVYMNQFQMLYTGCMSDVFCEKPRFFDVNRFFKTTRHPMEVFFKKRPMLQLLVPKPYILQGLVVSCLEVSKTVLSVTTTSVLGWKVSE